MKLYLVRHGQTDWNAENKRQGRTDVPLNETGRAQALALAEKTKNLEFDICYSSPLSRALETAKIVLDNKAKIITDDRLIERDFGELEGTTSEDRLDPELKTDTWDISANTNYKGIEPVQEILERTRKFLDDLIVKNPKDAKILIVAHAGSLKALYYNIVGYDETTNFHEFELKNAEMKELDI
ncbi:histidine phosphatase family protein [Candidatus Saccharibacteria bacterium]|nr:histidine phosphatase family protein [Candidatus Saccharibacteria bacterium]